MWSLGRKMTSSALETETSTLVLRNTTGQGQQTTQNKEIPSYETHFSSYCDRSPHSRSGAHAELEMSADAPRWKLSTKTSCAFADDSWPACRHWRTGNDVVSNSMVRSSARTKARRLRRGIVSPFGRVRFRRLGNRRRCCTLLTLLTLRRRHSTSPAPFGRASRPYSTKKSWQKTACRCSPHLGRHRAFT